MTSIVGITARAVPPRGALGRLAKSIATLIVGFLVVDAVAVVIIWLAVRTRRGR